MDQSLIFGKRYSRVIQIELNEISKKVIDHLISKNQLPHFSQIQKNWYYLETTSESQYEYLEPWIQWITAHTGKTFSEHGIFHLGDCVELKHPQIWETLSAFNIESGIVGSMNAVRGQAKKGFFFPDPWSKYGKTYPSTLQSLWDLISKKVQSHATAPITTPDLLKGLAVCRHFHLSSSLYRRIIGQWILQKLDPMTRWKMVGIFDIFLAEIFSHLIRTTRYGYYTLFLNSVAHYQHHYWRQFDNDLFHKDIRIPDCRKNHDPMTYGYKLYDRILKYALTFSKDPNTLVIIASGLSQEPFLNHENEGGMNYYRLKTHLKFMKCFNFGNCKVLPLMSRDWQIEPKNLKQLDSIERELKGLRVLGEPLFKIHRNTEYSLFIETAITRHIPSSVEIITHEGKSLGKFHRFFIKIAIKSGHHSGKGSLWLSQKPLSNTHSIPLSHLYQLTLNALGVSTNCKNYIENQVLEIHT